MAKKKREKPHREVTKHQLSRWQQQKRRQRIILIVGIAVIASVSAIVGVNYYIDNYKPLHQIVIEVNDRKFDMDYYIKLLEVYGGSYSEEYMPYVAEQVVQEIQQNALIIQGAEKLGVTVSDDEVDEELNNYDPPLSSDLSDAIRAQLLITELYNGYFDERAPLFAEQRHIMAMLLESGSQVTEVKARLENGEDFGELAGELSLDDSTKTENGDLGWTLRGILSRTLGSTVVEEYAFSAEVVVLSQPLYDGDKVKSVGYWLVKVLERDDEIREAHIEGILLGSEAEAQRVRARLEAGEDFATLAEELSQDSASKESGGDLGWLASVEEREEEENEEEVVVGVIPDKVSPALDEFVFSSELGTLSQPIRDETVQTKGAYWLVKVADIDSYREIDEENRDILKSDLLNEWVLSLWGDPENKIESYLDDELKAFAIEQATKGSE